MNSPVLACFFCFVLFLSPRVCIQSTVWVNLTGSLTSIVPMCLESSNCKLAQYNINIHNVHYSGIWGRKMWRGSYVSHLPFCDNDVFYSAEWSHSHNQFFKHTSLDFTSSHFLSCLIKVWFFFPFTSHAYACQIKVSISLFLSPAISNFCSQLQIPTPILTLSVHAFRQL